MEAIGKNLGEHPCFLMSGFTVNDSSLFPRINPEDTEKISMEYHNGEGFLSLVPEGPQCFITSSVAEPDWPDLWLEIHPHLHVNGEEQEFTFIDVVGRPKSRGTFSFDTEKYKAGIRDDVELALIDYQFYSNPDDIQAMLEGKMLLTFISGYFCSFNVCFFQV